VLARLEPTDLQLAAQADAATVSGAQTELTLAESELARYLSLHEKGFISAAVLDQKQAAADGARSRLQAAESSRAEKGRQVGYSTLFADTDGVVTWLQMDAGQVVAAGQNLLKIAQAGTREIEVHVPEARMAEFKAAKVFSVTLNALPDHPLRGSLRELAAAADATTRTYVARITLAQEDAQLALGMSATVDAVAPTSTAIHLPLVAIISRDGKPMVWKLDTKNALVHAIAIQTSGVDGNDIVVSGGLNPGDIVVTAGASLLREGQQVQARP
jgi:membrane fusion protein, multidrug efflux system